MKRNMSNGKNGSETLFRTRRQISSVIEKNAVLRERRIATPSSDLQVVKIGERGKKPKVTSKEKASFVVAKVGKAMRRPGMDRTLVFKSVSDASVFAYSIDPKDRTRFVREDASGRTTVGRVVSGQFRPSTTE
jgi:hypothetical protein